jgi:hypothetical protein
MQAKLEQLPGFSTENTVDKQTLPAKATGSVCDKCLIYFFLAALSSLSRGEAKDSVGANNRAYRLKPMMAPSTGPST